MRHLIGYAVYSLYGLWAIVLGFLLFVEPENQTVRDNVTAPTALATETELRTLGEALQALGRRIQREPELGPITTSRTTLRAMDESMRTMRKRYDEGTGTNIVRPMGATE